MIVIGQYGDNYASRLVDECRSVLEGDIYYFTFCMKDFKGGEYKVRLVDKHCGNGPDSCNNSCSNPRELAKLIGNGESVVLVVRGKYGNSWNSDKLSGIARMGVEILKSGDREYLGGVKAERLCLVLPHEPYSKQDKLFLKDENDPESRLEGECKTLKLQRRIFNDLGVDLMLTVLPHDYREEGFVRKKAYIGREDKIFTNWQGLDTKGLVYVEDWDKFLCAINPTPEIASYIRREGLKFDAMVSPDLTSNRMCAVLKQELGIWGDVLKSKRSRDDASEIKTEGFFGEVDESKIKGKNIAIVDDWVLAGGKSRAAIDMLKKYNPARIDIIACHGECVGDICDFYEKQGIGMHFTDTVESPYAKIPTTAAVAERIKQRFLD